MSVDIFLRGDRRSLIPFYSRTYTFNDRRYGYYQPNGYGRQYPGQNTADQYPAGSPLGEDRFKYDPVSENWKLRRTKEIIWRVSLMECNRRGSEVGH